VATVPPPPLALSGEATMMIVERADMPFWLGRDGFVQYASYQASRDWSVT
jgi:hypothetical protein